MSSGKSYRATHSRVSDSGMGHMGMQTVGLLHEKPRKAAIIHDPYYSQVLHPRHPTNHSQVKALLTAEMEAQFAREWEEAKKLWTWHDENVEANENPHR